MLDVSHLPRPRAVLFDWDGTLVDTWKAILAAYNITRVAMGMDPWDEESARLNIRKSWRDAFPEVFGDRWQEAGEIYREQYTNISQEHIEPIRGVFEFLHDLKNSGIYVAIVSNKRGSILRGEVTYFNWDSHFSRIVGAQDAARDKPHVDPVIMALDGSGIEMGPDVWFVGDTGLDMQTAHAGGMTGMLVNVSSIKDGEREQFPPAAEFAELSSLHEAWISVMNPEHLLARGTHV